MGRTRETLEMPQDLIAAVRSEKCVAFIGSGVSADSYPSWHELITELCERCGITRHVTRDTPADELQAAAQDAKTLDEEAYHAFLTDRFGSLPPTIPRLYDVLLELTFSSYLTTNFDRVLAYKSSLARRRCNERVYAYPSLDRKAMNSRSVHYLHGRITNGPGPVKHTIVLARDEFKAAYGSNSNLMNFLVETLVQDPLVFIGCTLREPQMKEVFRICRDNQLERQRANQGLGLPRGNSPKRFIFLPPTTIETRNGCDDALDSEVEQRREDEQYRSMGIEPVRYSAEGRDHSQLCLALDRLTRLSKREHDHGRADHGWEGDTHAR